MEYNHQLNRKRISVVAKVLEQLDLKVVFVGGSTVSLYVPEGESMEHRPTNDIDVVVEILSYDQYGELEGRLRDVGFRHDTESKVIGRFIVKGITVDIMPTGEDSLGFVNRWNTEGFHHAQEFILEPDTVVYILPLSYFIASKLEAYRNRPMTFGTSSQYSLDYRSSRDIEDIVYLLDTVPDVEKLLAEGPSSVQGYLFSQFSLLLDDHDFEEGVESHFRDYKSVRTGRILEILTYYCSR